MGQETPTEKHFFSFRRHGKYGTDSDEGQSKQSPHDKEKSPSWPSWLGGRPQDSQKEKVEVKESEGGHMVTTTVQLSVQTESKDIQPSASALRYAIVDYVYHQDESANTAKPAGSVTVDQAVGNAQKDVNELNLLPGLAQNAVNTIEVASAVATKIDTVDSYLTPLKIFSSVVTTIAGVHPYAAIALAALTTAANVGVSL
ncbi:hypothetical protein EDD17DRAFT_1894550 [Pisolithus thermaeus]|nr:hypothetical protein EDD17DRAFT_1894550 [Pisolithus thermaeus]